MDLLLRESDECWVSLGSTTESREATETRQRLDVTGDEEEKNEKITVLVIVFGL